MPSLSESYVLTSTPRMEAAIHRAWTATLGDPQALLAEMEAAAHRRNSGRAGQGFTALAEVHGTPMYCKIYEPGRISRRLRDLLGNYRARLEWEATCAAADAGIRPATLVAAITLKSVWNCHHLVLTLPAPGRSIRDLLVERRDDPVAREELLRLVGRTVAEWHRAGFRHAHLNMQHLFLDDHHNLTAIDFEASAVAPPLSIVARERNLRQVRDSLRKTLKSDDHFPAVRAAYDSAWRQARPAVVQHA